ncbi:hypothetical protein A4A49_07398 [Nicotiana attenuata]|uniref:Uncharacterized protein n=1 Tax=Nicotiana attenuata TaxID=49451 RepID=A0A314L8W2_NICAT|nr:hypothetical protein A4A49_07398 [Nicotiana attenuata]
MVSSGTAELFFLKIKWANFSSEVLFVLIVGAEAYVTMRSQFPHPNKVMLVHAAVTLATSVGAMICLARDIHVNVRNKLPMQGRRERDFENCWYGYAKLCNYCRNIWTLNITKAFDMWSINVRTEEEEEEEEEEDDEDDDDDRRDVNFNMIEMRGNVIDGGIWKFPPTDFVILYFSLMDENSFDRVTTTVDTRNDRLNNQQDLYFVTRDQGCALACQAVFITIRALLTCLEKLKN